MAKFYLLTILISLSINACGVPDSGADLSDYYVTANLQRQETSPFRLFESEEERVGVFSDWLKQQSNTRSIFFQEASPSFRDAVKQSDQFQWIEPKNAFESYDNMNRIGELIPTTGPLGTLARIGGMAYDRWSAPPSYQGLAIPKDSRVIGDVVFEPSSQQSIQGRLTHNAGVTYVPVEHSDGSRELIATWHFDHDPNLSLAQQKEAISTLSSVRERYSDFSFRGGGDTNNNLLRDAWSNAGFHLPPADLGATYDPVNNIRAEKAVTGNAIDQPTNIDHVILANPISPSSRTVGNINEATWSIRPNELQTDHYVVSAFVPDDRRLQGRPTSDANAFMPMEQQAGVESHLSFGEQWGD